MSGPAPIAKANTGELPYTFGWTDGPNNGLGYAYGAGVYHVPYYYGHFGYPYWG